ncbi:MAG: hypothetical protein KJ620_10715 [Candidatus Edwardsbacteria bacterium]|nr:hypothetical protein [Candidatus Edwardsbacteria bacterium]MBU1576166.1 hypothetical protein [Candidatus Edwardsbacteria bacterium]MBU2463590.1 hypothetical protein [Candidatus Edwardsbacteria bacterium]MBU2593206.1 hypothetical protein [Candidatus Edwardsbacteria bacterium]
MKLFLRLIIVLSLTASLSWAARFPIIGGPGLVHLQSAKAGSMFGYRTVNSFSSYSQQSVSYLAGAENSYNDIWSHQLLSFAPLPNLSLMLSGLAHGEQWTITSPGGDSLDNTLGCPGDITISAKYSLALADQMVDLGIMPIISIPMDKDKYNDGPSQSGKLDFGAKILGDINLRQSTMYVNLGFLTRGDQRPQVPAGVGYEYGFSQKFSAFAEVSAEMRVGAATDSLPDSLILSGRGFDRTEARFTPGIHYVPLDILGLSLSADIGLTKASAPWQITLGLDLPAAAGRAISGVITGAIAGLIKDRDTGVPMKGMITFPGAGIPGSVSDDIGKYLAELPPGDYKIHIYANGYRWLERKIKVEPGKKEKWDLTLKRKLGTIKGTVSDAATGQPIAASFSFVGKDLPEFSANPQSGEYSTLIPPGKYNLSVTADGYRSQNMVLTTRDRKEVVNDLTLQPIASAPVAYNTTASRTYQPPQVSAPVVPPAPKTTVSAKPARTVKPKAAAPKPAASAKLSADEINALYKTGVKQYMNEEYDKAVKTFQKLLKSDPGHAKAKDYLAKAKDRLKKIKG